MFRLSASGLMERPKLEQASFGKADPSAAHVGKRPIFVNARGGIVPADIYDFEKLSPGNVVTGPAVVHTPITTIVLQANQIGRIDGYRNVIIDKV